MSSNWFRVEWLLFALVWLAAAGTSKRTLRREGIWNTIVHGSLLVIAFLLLFKPVRWGQLDARFIRESDEVVLGGFVLIAAGLAFAVWARLKLGRNWSGTVTITKDHRLIREGPYRLVRHPIYSGILLAMAGTAMGYGRASCLIGLALAFLALWIKAQTEERFMIARFGSMYVQYQQEVKAFIPSVL